MKKLLIILLFCYPTHMYSQGWALEYSIGYATYQLDDIKNLQHSILTNFNNYGLKETDCFPNYITHSVSLSMVTGNQFFGGNFSYLTTGGRLHRADYSGSYTVDMIMNGFRFGVFDRYCFDTGNTPLYTYLQLGAGVLYTYLRMKEQVIIYSESAQETSYLNGVGIYLEPSIGATYQLTNRLNFTLRGGYEIDFASKLKLSGQVTQYNALWNGIRLYGGLIFNFHTQQNLTL